MKVSVFCQKKCRAWKKKKSGDNIEAVSSHVLDQANLCCGNKQTLNLNGNSYLFLTWSAQVIAGDKFTNIYHSIKYLLFS